MIKIYTDGSCGGNGKVDAPGGWAILILNSKNPLIQTVKYARELATTNNRMEMMAMYMALVEASKNPDERVEVYCDSDYVVRALKEKWYKKWQYSGWKTSTGSPVANKDLWEDIISLYQSLSNVVIVKVKGHVDVYNKIVDKYAVSARINEELIPRKIYIEELR